MNRSEILDLIKLTFLAIVIWGQVFGLWPLFP